MLTPIDVSAGPVDHDVRPGDGGRVHRAVDHRRRRPRLRRPGAARAGPEHRAVGGRIGSPPGRDDEVGAAERQRRHARAGRRVDLQHDVAPREAVAVAVLRRRDRIRHGRRRFLSPLPCRRRCRRRRRGLPTRRCPPHRPHLRVAEPAAPPRPEAPALPEAPPRPAVEPPAPACPVVPAPPPPFPPEPVDTAPPVPPVPAASPPLPAADCVPPVPAFDVPPDEPALAPACPWPAVPVPSDPGDDEHATARRPSARNRTRFITECTVSSSRPRAK